MTNAFGAGEKIITTILIVIFLSLLLSSLFLLISSIHERLRFKHESLPSLEEISDSKYSEEEALLTDESIEKNKESSLFDIDEIGEREKAIDPMYGEIATESRVQTRQQNRAITRKNILKKK